MNIWEGLGRKAGGIGFSDKGQNGYILQGRE